MLLKYSQLEIYICNNKQIFFDAENQINTNERIMNFQTLLRKKKPGNLFI